MSFECCCRLASSKLVFRSCIIVSFVIIGVSYTCSESFRLHLFSVFPAYRNLVFSVQEAFLFFSVVALIAVRFRAESTLLISSSESVFLLSASTVFEQS